MSVRAGFVEELRQALRLRRISAGLAMLPESVQALNTLEAADPEAAALLLVMAQWVDVGYRDYRLLDSLLLKFPACERSKLPLESYLRVRLVEAFRALSAAEVDAAIETLEFVQQAARDLADEQVVTLAHFWKGRAHRKKGEYEVALRHIVAAREMAERSPDDGMFTAVIQTHEAWLLFQKGMRKEALRLLAQAEAALAVTDHYLALGNIESARGRITRRAGEYARALEHFDKAIAIYTQADPNHVNIARTLVNAAYAKRVLALQLRKRIDAQVRMQNQRSGEGRGQAANGRGGLRARHQQICQEAMEQLQRAREIFALHNHSVGLGSVVLNAGYLHMDRGDIDSAAVEAQEAYKMGVEKNDHILMARARVLQTATENARVEEGVGEEADAALHANHAHEYSEEALALSRQTQNRPLLASAFIARGMTAANDFFQEWELAKRCASEAAESIGAGENDHLLDELAALKSHIMQASGINDTLRAWSEGMVGGKTFQQITEEFAEIVIPKVWMREERKISRVAACLSVSPKKVRRILRNAGLLGGE
jgi:tetratricopeptide (TPR) repeat protein